MKLASVLPLLLVLAVSQGLAAKLNRKHEEAKIKEQQIRDAARLKESPNLSESIEGPAKKNVVPPIALSQARTTDVTTPEDPLPFPENVVDIGESWLRPTHVNVSRSGVFFFHVNAGARAGKPVNVNVRWDGQNYDVYRGSTNHNGTDTIGRNFIAAINAPSMVHFENEPAFELFADEGRQTGFSMIDLQGFLDPYQQKIFSVSRRTDFAGTGMVEFNEEDLNVGGDFDIFGRQFVVKRSGPHFITFTAGVKNGTDMRASIMTKYQGFLSETWHSSTNINNPDLVSKSLMVDLVAGDAVSVQLTGGELYSDAERQTSFSGFYYDTLDGHPTTWSVYSVQSVTASGGLLDPMPFHGQFINTNGMYSFVSHQVTITQPGLYYIELNVQAQPHRRVNALVVLGTSKAEFSVDRSSTSHVETGALSNGLMLELFMGNTLKVVLGEDSSVYSDNNKLVVFTGFMVYPYPDV